MPTSPTDAAVTVLALAATGGDLDETATISALTSTASLAHSFRTRPGIRPNHHRGGGTFGFGPGGVVPHPLGLAPTCPITGLPILEVSRSGPMATIATNIEGDLISRGATQLQLTRVTSTVRDANRRAALAGRGRAGTGSSWDEFPFASSNLGGSSASVMAVPAAEQNVQGGVLSAFYRANGITPGSSFLVRIVP